jgi:uncharacterized protein YbjQ (UPF0145 family)
MSSEFKVCTGCDLVVDRSIKICRNCYGSKFRDAENGEDLDSYSELIEKVLELSKSVQCFTTDVPVSRGIKREFGLVFGTSSKQAFWGLSTQADRLNRAYDAALSNLRYEAAALGANAVIGIRFALNNSTGSGNTLITGSSEAVMLLGTAVVIE